MKPLAFFRLMRETRCQEHILLPGAKVSISYSLKTELDYITINKLGLEYIFGTITELPTAR